MDTTQAFCLFGFAVSQAIVNYFQFRINNQLRKKMSENTDAIAAAEANVQAATALVTTVKAGVLALDAQIIDLKAKIAAFGTPESLKPALDQLVTDSANLVAQLQATDTTAPADPVVTPPPATDAPAV